MLLDLADPMARLVADTTQTEAHFMAQQTETDVQNEEDAGCKIAPSNDGEYREAGPASIDPKSTNVQLHIEPNVAAPYNTNSQLPSPDVDDITKNGNYHRSDSFDFVQMQQLPRVQQPVFERVLMPEKKRPAIQKVPDPRANVARQEIVLHQSGPTQVYKNYAYDGGYGEPDAPPPRYASRGNTNSHQTNRYRDVEDGGPPMMVIRDYSRAIPTSTYAYNTNKDNYGREAEHMQVACRNGSCGHKEHHRNSRNVKSANNNPIRPGFVANAAKMWDRRAADHSVELNTIV